MSNGSNQVFDINKLYDQTITALKKGERPQHYLSPEEIELALQHLEKLNEERAKPEDFMQILCILDHSKKGHLDFVSPITEILNQRQESDLLIYTMTAALKVIIEECERQGRRVPFEFIKSLPPLLNHNDPEVVEWSLRTIEALGNQAILLKEDIVKARPGISALFNKHKKNTRELVDFILRKWDPHE